MHRQPNLTLPYKGQGQTRVIIYINLVKLFEALMLHAKFQDHKSLGSEEEEDF